MKINKLGVYKMKKETDALSKNDEFLVTAIDHLNEMFYTPAIGAFMPWNYPAKFLGDMNPPKDQDQRARPADNISDGLVKCICYSAKVIEALHPPNVEVHRAGEEKP